jgi:hypothetical protein
VASGALLPPPAPAPGAPSAVAPPAARTRTQAAPAAPPVVTAPAPLSPAAGFSAFPPKHPASIDDPTFYGRPRVEEPAPEPTRSELDLIIANGGRGAPSRGRATLALTAIVLAAAAGAGWWLTRGSDDTTPTIRSTYSEATGDSSVDVEVPAEATTGAAYVITIPPGWNATSRLVGPGRHHLDVALARPVVGIEGAITSTRTTVVPSPRADVTAGASAVTAFSQDISGSTAHGVRFTLAGTRHEEVVLDRAGVVYDLDVHAPLVSTKEMTADLAALLKGWTFGA